MSRDRIKTPDVSMLLGAEAKQILSSIEREWREMCGNQLRPTLSGMNPTKMESSLPYAFVIKREGPGIGRVRVAGQRVHDYFGEDLQSRSFGEFFDERFRATATELMETAFTLPAIVSFSLVAKRKFGRRPVRAQILLLPMRDPVGNVTRLLGALVTDATPCPHPLRFEIDHTQPFRCDEQDGAFPDRRLGSRSLRKASPTSVPRPAIVPRKSGFKPTPQPTEKAQQTRSHLRLVVDNS